MDARTGQTALKHCLLCRAQRRGLLVTTDMCACVYVCVCECLRVYVCVQLVYANVCACLYWLWRLTASAGPARMSRFCNNSNYI